MYKTVQKFEFGKIFFMFLKEVSYAHQSCIYITVFLDCIHTFPASVPNTLRTLHTNLKTHTHTQWAKPLNSSAKWNFTFKTMLYLLKMLFCFQMTDTNHHMN